MLSVLNLMILCLDLDSLEDLANLGSAEATPADFSRNVLSIPFGHRTKFGILIPSDLIGMWGASLAKS